MVTWTKEQEAAIHTAGKDVLVAAAAGSGKTAVLVERIIQKLIREQQPLDIDELLVVTFSNAAAQEMRTRVGAALEKALSEHPGSMHLKKQLSLMPKASISTLHAFCLEIVRQHAYLLDIDPGFRILDEMEADLLRQEVMDDLLESWYGGDGVDQESFFAVVDRFSSDRNDMDVVKLLEDLYQFSIQNPWPEQWLDGLTAMYEVPDDWKEADLTWLDMMKNEITEKLEGIMQEIMFAMNAAREADGPYLYIDTIEKDYEMVAQARKISSWGELQQFLSEHDFTRLPGKKMDCSEDKKEKVKSLRNAYKKDWQDLKKHYFARNLQGHVQDMQELAPIVKQLAEMVKIYSSHFAKLKREKAVMDFSDLEHYCLALLLSDSATPDHIVPSNVARSLQQQFSEVLVDEYQDTNLVQETILKLISDQDGAGNMFMVGDVKQSIYRFRHAEPGLFIDKYKRYADESIAPERIDLASNFRSRKLVLSGTNYIFRQIMDEKLGEITYDKDAELIYANHTYDEMPYEFPNPELLIIDRDKQTDEIEAPDEGENYLDLEKAQLEARAYAQKIKQWIGKEGEQKPQQVFDKSTQKQRDVQYRDIVILMRSMTWAPTIVDELKKQGIPVYAELSSGYFAAIEVKIMLSFLKAIDNPRQDIPLASVLKSPIVSLNEEELSRIRLASPKSVYYVALTKYSKQHNDPLSKKVQRFLQQLDDYRTLSKDGALSELIWQIYRETGYYDFVGGMPGGKQRQANLRALYDRARSYEASSFRGLFRFLRFVERMEENDQDLGAARALSEQEDVVRVMTIHKSKGLEYPIVIVGAMDKEFNQSDVKKPYLLHKNLGFASKYIDPVKRITYPTLYYQAVKNQLMREALAEEMRVLYVALTRAREKLVMVGNVASLEKKREKWQKMATHAEWVLPAHFRSKLKTYLDLVAAALIRHENNEQLRLDPISEQIPEAIRFDSSQWDIHILHGSELANLEENVPTEEKQLKTSIVNWEHLPVDNANLDQFVSDRLAYQYPYAQAAEARAKQTVTEIKRQQEARDEFSSEQLVAGFQAPIVKRPAFMQREKTFSAAEKGTAMHTVMQHIPFERKLTDVEIAEFVQGLVHKEILLQEAADTINIEAIAKFFETALASYMADSTKIYREVPFSLALPAEEVYANWQFTSEEHVLIQGVLDCVIPKDDGWIILDYKTDAVPTEVTPKVERELIERYDVQLQLYRKAIEQIWQQPVKAMYLYFFSGQLLLEV